MRKLIAMTAVLAAVANPSVQAFAGDEGNIGYLSKHTTLEIRIFADMSYIKNESDGVTVDPTGYGFDVKRGYLTLDTDLSEAWSVRFRTDFNYKSAVGETVVYIKNLYVQRDFGNGMKLRIGAADLPWVSYVQNLYRYRYVEKVLVDRVDFGTSADWGLHLLGGADKLNWQVSLVSGAGYKHPLRGRSMDIGARIDYQPVAGLHLGLGVRTGHLGQNSQSAPAAHTASRYDAAIAWVADDWNLGLEYFYAENFMNVTTSYGNSADGYSLFGSYSITPRIALFARYDHVRPCHDTTPACASDLVNTYYNLGVQFNASSEVKFALVYKYSRVAHGFFDTANGLIGGVNSGTYQEIGVFMQMDF